MENRFKLEAAISQSDATELKSPKEEIDITVDRLKLETRVSQSRDDEVFNYHLGNQK